MQNRNLSRLTDEQQIEAEDDCRICVRGRSEKEARPKRKTRKTREEDDEIGGSTMTIRAVFENGAFPAMDQATLGEGTVPEIHDTIERHNEHQP